MSIFQRIGDALKGINRHSIAHFGLSLIGVAGAIQLPYVQSALDLVHDGGATKLAANHGAIALFGIGSAITYLTGIDKVGTVNPPPSVSLPDSK